MAESRKVQATISYQCAPHVVWSVERKGVLLLNQNSGSILHLDYPQAAVWNLISKSYSFDQTIPMLCAIASMNTAQAKQLVVESLDVWIQAGFLTMRDKNG